MCRGYEVVYNYCVRRSKVASLFVINVLRESSKFVYNYCCIRGIKSSVLFVINE